jgi:enoyl-CoA hydratase/carnithine racemase
MFELSFDGEIARLRLRRPEARNAITLAGWGELAARIEETERRARLLIVSGEGSAFCAGADISSFDRFAEDESRTGFRLAIRIALDRLRDTPVPTLAVIDGGCYGAGVALAMACDMRLAGPHALFAITPAKLGISYPQEDVHRLVSLVGPGQASRLLFGAQTINGAEAQRIGLVEQFHAEGLDEAVAAFSAALLANDPASLRTLKRSIALAAGGVRQDDRQDSDFDALLGSEALAARLAAHRSRPR